MEFSQAKTVINSPPYRVKGYLWLVFIFLLPNAYAFNAVDYYPLRVGQEWQYISNDDPPVICQAITGTQIINGLELFVVDFLEGFYLSGHCDSPPFYYYHDGNGLRCYGETNYGVNGSGRTVSKIRPPVILLPANFQIGTVKRTTGIIGSDIDYTTTVTIVRETNITVPLGTFSTIEIVIETDLDISFFPLLVERYWLAKDIGPVRIRAWDNTVLNLQQIRGFPDGDNDGVPDVIDTDDDNDGTFDGNDAFPFNPNESVDSDGDGLGNNSDQDDDNDGRMDNNDDLPLNPNEHSDTDRDGVGDNADADDDNDGFPDSQDAFPLEVAESVDTDGDSTGNNSDQDDDGDTLPDIYELIHDLDPLNAIDATSDKDSDGLSNLLEYLHGSDINQPDTDHDGITDGDEVNQGRNPTVDEAAVILLINGMDE